LWKIDKEMGWGSVGIRGYKMKIENFKTKLKECPKCGCGMFKYFGIRKLKEASK